ncbi:BatA domain-containing protein [Endozoicomonas elysicola]|uniref:BatA domain-containing protein n=1 Tax=Endozoicomonas elysicola TaxID=305900 RepID=UPI0003707A32|nr:BatA domain-containing protein [Endozoicomonas elysicola]
MIFANPVVLWLLLLLPLIGIYRWRQGSEGVTWSHLPLVDDLPKSYRQQWQWLPLALQLMALAALIVAAAQPRKIHVASTEEREGIAMAIALDMSSSMKIRMDMAGERVSRLSVAKKVLGDFILGDEDQLPGRDGDLISLVTFARFPTVVSPLTTSHDSLVFMGNQIEPPTIPGEDGTAFGDATALAAAQLSEYEEHYNLKNNVASKVLILITDGENNAGQYTPAMAASMAKAWGVRIYAIFIGNQPRDSVVDSNENTDRVDWMLQAMADQTGGFYHRVHDYDSLVRVYQAIDQLETSRLQTLTYEDHTPAFQFVVIIGLLCLMAASFLSATWLRRVG